MFQLEIAPSLATKPENLGKSGTPSPNAMARISSSSHTSPRKARTLSAKSAVVLEHGTRRANTLLSMSLSTTLAKSQPSKSNSLTIIPNKVQTTTTATKRRKRYADGLDDATNTMFQKPRVEEDAQKQQIMGFNGAAKIVSQVENQQLHLELEPVFDNGVQSDNFESFYREPSAVLENYLMDADSGFTSTSNAAPPTVFTLDPAENLQPSDNDGDAAATEDDDFPPEIFGLLDLSGYCDEEDGVPATQETAEASAYWVQAIPTIDPSFTADAIDYYLERGVFDSSLANCSGSFLQMQLQAATSPIQENEIQMISNPFHMKRYR
ncbi:hypothetical protein NC652_017654 [Populus alba x Populus x berolinensis]|nr:hypothetical protein NC652_017654 [Populus alba x Populus x berolinensis]